MDPVETPEDGFVMPPWIYNKIKFLALVLLPALTTLYFTLGGIWDLPTVEQVIGTMTALDTFLGVMIGLSAKNFNKSADRYDGHIVITEKEDGTKVYSLELNRPPEEIDDMKMATFKVGAP